MKDDNAVSLVTLKQPKFPANGKHAHHARAALAMLLRGDEVDQYLYAEETGFPCTDFRTRISDLGKLGWIIDRRFHWGVDHTDTTRRCKEYYLDSDLMQIWFDSDPEFWARCGMLRNGGAANVA